MIDRAALADFLRRRQQALQPEDVGLPRGQRRRTSGLRREEVKRFVHPEIGLLQRQQVTAKSLHCQTLLDPEQSHLLLVYTAVPGSESYEKLQLLSVIGAQTLT